ncbi:multiple sugar transport system permease protein [Microbacteriaceae bacterium SG_E_30_P1]|uniref:Multiple sugar transport system permease protein n=1 Tax=Antiquaquibacter oligotrophicus TaxID=2880260 RepID=A0ABT6KRJ5_9MICO|nr:sugar ABC transporter permease [Antiquaquibacter oligotrophicus]MDH6182093.1 multiple sugar transport system permease protein [Antiquaquibacter oligotrophicus]UDF12242.1 sugar ABC transporter permease [Antiquaquibacter oligotrophicus]
MTTTAKPTLAPRRHVANTVSNWVDRNLKWIFTAPAIAFVALLIIFPIGYTVFLSLTDSASSVTRPFDFIGFDNYAYWLTDVTRFWPAVGRTAYFTAVALTLELGFGLAIALLLRKTFRGQSIVRVFILLPLVATPVAVGMMWLLIFEPTIGFANVLMKSLGLPAQLWLSGKESALNTIIFIDVWQWTPMIILILLAGLSTIPEEPEEAALVDGANAWQRFRHVTLPLLMPTLGAAAILRSIDAMKTFDIIYATKGRNGGSNNEAETLNMLAYNESFGNSQYGSAAALLMLFLTFIIIILAVLAILRKKGTRV